MDWYEKGKLAYEGFFTEEGERVLGSYEKSHLRALVRLTQSSDEQREVERGFYDRRTEIINMGWEEFSNWLATQRTKPWMENDVER